MRYLKISNNGVININALTLMGASTKRGNADQIGFFGTGNKYALACFLRNDIGVRIFAGDEEIKISTEPASIGDDSYDVVYINGVATSITTSMGPTWEVWQAIREVYSNAMDATGGSFEIVSDVTPAQRETHFYIELTGDVKSVSDNFDQYFSADRRPMFDDGSVSVYPEGTGTVYRKGIRCIRSGINSLYDYDFETLPINEMRLAEINWRMGEPMWQALLNCDKPAVVANVIEQSTNENYLEIALLGSSLTDLPCSMSGTVENYATGRMLATDDMRILMSDREIESATFINARLLNHFINHYGRENMTLPGCISSTKGVNYVPIEPTQADQNALDSALHKLAALGVSIGYPIIFARLSSPNVLALADFDEKQILVTEKLFTHGETWIISTLLEEWIHIKHDAKDCTRDMQTAMLNEFAGCVIRMNELKERAA